MLASACAQPSVAEDRNRVAMARSPVCSPSASVQVPSAQPSRAGATVSPSRAKASWAVTSGLRPAWIRRNSLSMALPYTIDVFDCSPDRASGGAVASISATRWPVIPPAEVSVAIGWISRDAAARTCAAS